MFNSKGLLVDYTLPNFLNYQKYKHRMLCKPFIEEKIYVSVTSIFNNQEILLQTLTSIINQTKIPDNIFVYLSESPYMLDSGFKHKKITNKNLYSFLKIGLNPCKINIIIIINSNV